jgi:hypothetical protein
LVLKNNAKYTHARRADTGTVFVVLSKRKGKRKGRGEGEEGR